jgi:hypothetical protein
VRGAAYDGRAMLLLELSALGLTALSFAIFDLYARACERI